MIAVDLSILGDKKLIKAMKRLDAKVQKKIARKAIRDGGKVVLAASRVKLAALSNPNDSPQLMKLVSRKLKLRAMKRSRVRQGVNIVTPTKEQIGLPPDHKWYPPAHILLGTKKTAAKPAMRPAIEENRDRVLRKIRVEVWRGIKAEAARGR